MTITFYHNTSENNRVDKSSFLDESTKLTIQGTLRDECSIMNPVIMIEYTATATFMYNYCLIPYFNRYYYINNITCVRNGLYRLELSVDVLMTYKTDILQQKAVISRQENEYNLYLPDNSFKVYSYPQIQTKTFPNGFLDTANFVLLVAGSD